MTRLLLYFTACFLVCGCGKNQTPQAASAWLADKLAAGASAGTSQTFDPVDGKIVVKFENASTVSTRIAIWRK